MYLTLLRAFSAFLILSSRRGNRAQTAGNIHIGCQQKYHIFDCFPTTSQNELWSRFGKLFFASSPSLPWQHGRRQHGWYIRETLKKQFTKPTPQLILGRSIGNMPLFGHPLTFVLCGHHIGISSLASFLPSLGCTPSLFPFPETIYHPAERTMARADPAFQSYVTPLVERLRDTRAFQSRRNF